MTTTVFDLGNHNVVTEKAGLVVGIGEESMQSASWPVFLLVMPPQPVFFGGEVLELSLEMFKKIKPCSINIFFVLC